MRAMVWNLKGGVGKTSISVSLALENGWSVATNDYHSPLEKILPNGMYLKMQPHDDLPVPPDEYDVIYDFGGKADGRILDAVGVVDVIVVPVIHQAMQDMHATLSSLTELQHEIDELSAKGHSRISMKKVIVVINRAGKKADESAQIVRDIFPDCQVVILKESTLFTQVIEKKSSVAEICKNPLLRVAFSSVRTQFMELDKRIKEVANVGGI